MPILISNEYQHFYKKNDIHWIELNLNISKLQSIELQSIKDITDITLSNNFDNYHL